ncbi:MAG TPA: DUF1761 family protein [Terriglobales bacterium]
MSALQLGLAFIFSFIVCQLADWVFAGVLFHGKYQAAPEIWRPRFQGKGETVGIIISSIFTAISVIAIELLLVAARAQSYTDALVYGVAIWFAAALPLIASNAVFIRVHPLNASSHAVGWLVKLVATAVITVFFAHRAFLAR